MAQAVTFMRTLQKTGDVCAAAAQGATDSTRHTQLDLSHWAHCRAAAAIAAAVRIMTVSASAKVAAHRA
jgi:hypothetical protein